VDVVADIAAPEFLCHDITSEKRQNAQYAVDETKQDGEYCHPGMPLERNRVDSVFVHYRDRSSEQKAQKSEHPSVHYQGDAQDRVEGYALQHVDHSTTTVPVMPGCIPQ
jgi:hypothetical protein